MANTSFVSFSDIDTIQNSGATAMKDRIDAGEVERKLHRLEHPALDALLGRLVMHS